MNEALIIDFTKNALILVLLLSLPPIIAASLIGLLVSLVQALTQIQEQTVSFAIKLIAVIVAVLLTAQWVGSEIYAFGLRLFESFPFLAR
jgi:type III secretion HrpO family protein